MAHPDAERAYQTDPQFRMMVDRIHDLLRRAEMTPAEVRQAAVLACTHYEMQRSPRLVFPDREDLPI